MSNFNRWFFRVVLFASLFFIVLSDNVSVGAGTLADIVTNMNKLSYMPRYCQCRVTESDFRKEFGNQWPVQFEKMRAKYIKIFGKSYEYLHHYCYGLRALQRASQIDSINYREKWKNELKIAIGEFEFVERSMGYPSFPLKAQLHKYKAETYNMLGEYQKAYRENKIASKYMKSRK